MLLETTFHLMNNNVYTACFILFVLKFMIIAGFEKKSVAITFIPTVIYTFLVTVGLFYVPIGELQ